MPSMSDLLTQQSQSTMSDMLTQQNVPSYEYNPTEAALPYMDTVRATEAEYGLPKNLLARMIETESHYNPNAMSSAGAAGIAQIMPDYHPNVDPFDPHASIKYAGGYLKHLYKRLGSWEKAVAAYNTGPGNVRKLGMEHLPEETVNYLKKVGVTSEPVETKSMAEMLSPKEGPAPPATKPPTVRKEETAASLAYGHTFVGAPIQGFIPGVITPELSAYMGRHGYGPKPPGGWDEFGNPRDENGNLYYKPEAVTNVVGKTLQGLSTIANPLNWHEIAKGIFDFGLSVPGFMTGMLGAVATTGRELINAMAHPEDVWEGDITLKDIYDKAAKSMQEGFEFYQPGKEALLGKPTETSQLVGQVAMAPLTAFNVGAQQLAGTGMFKNHHNIQGALMFAGDAMGIITMGMLLHGGRKTEFTKDLKDVVDEAKKIAETESTIDQSPESLLKAANKAALEAKKAQLDLQAKKIVDKIGEDMYIREELDRQAEEIAKAKLRPVTYTGMRKPTPSRVRAVMEKLPEGKMPEYIFVSNKGNTYMKVGDTWYNESREPITNKSVIEAAEAKKAKPGEEAPKYKPPERKVERPYKEVKGEMQELFDVLNLPEDFRNKLRRKRKIRVIEQTVAPGEEIKIPPTWHDAVFRYTAMRSPEGNLIAGEAGSYDSILMPGRVAGAKEGPIPPGHTLYLFDTGGYGTVAQTNTIRIYRAEAEKPTKVEPPKLPEPEGPPADLFTDESLVAAINEYMEGKLKGLSDEEIETFFEDDTVNDVDTQTGVEEPEISQEHSPFYQSPKDAEANAKVYEGRKLDSPEVFLQKLINDVNLWHSGKDISINDVREALRTLATRADDYAKDFVYSSDHKIWKKTVEQASEWASELDRNKPEPSHSPKLHAMIPIKEIPHAVRDALSEMKGFFIGNEIRLDRDLPFVTRSGDRMEGIRLSRLYRNRELFFKTGFWLGKDGMWRYELDDSGSSVSSDALYGYVDTNTIHRLDTVYRHPNLYQRVPDMTNVFIKMDSSYAKDEGSYNPGNKIITVGSADPSVIVHEVQHAINHVLGSKFIGASVQEGMTKATMQLVIDRLWELRDLAKTEGIRIEVDNTMRHLQDLLDNGELDNRAFQKFVNVVEKIPKGEISDETRSRMLNRKVDPVEGMRAYKADPGEMESRLADWRMSMSADERAAIPPWQSLDEMIAVEGFIPPKSGFRLYTGVPLEASIKYFKKLDVDLIDDIKKWLKGELKEIPSPRNLYRGIPHGTSIKETPGEYTHGTPWAMTAAKGGKFGGPHGYDVYKYPVTEKTLFYRGGSLSGDPLEGTRIPSARGMTWKGVMKKAKEIYYQDLTSERAEAKKRGMEPNEEYVADRVVRDIMKGTFEVDLGGKEGIWRGKATRSDIDKFYPRLRSTEDLRDAVRAKKMLGYEDEDIPEIKLLKKGGHELYAGVKPEDIIKSARGIMEYMEEARGYKKFKPKEAARLLKQHFTRAFVDRSGNIRRDFLKKLGEQGYEIVQAMYLARGATSMSASMLKQLRSEVYGGLTKFEKKILDGIILADRMIAIAKYKTPKEFKFPKPIEDYVRFRQAYRLKAINLFEDISPARARVLEQRARIYFDWMQRALKDLRDEGLLSDEEYERLVEHDYRKIQNVADIYDHKYRTKIGDKKRTIYDSGVEALARGRTTDLYEPSSEIMALEALNRTYGRILNNRANKTLLDLARSDPENPFVRTKDKASDRIPSGWSRLHVFENGERKSIYVNPDVAKEWIISNPEMSYKASQMLRYVSGSPILRTFATGINWGFALANLPRDVMHSWYAARVWENGQWKPVYSSHAPVFAMQMGRDLITTFSDALLRKGRYEKYIEEGGGMEFLVHQGRLFQRGRHLEGPMDAFYNYMGYFGETSEIMTRLAIRERVLRRRAKQAGITLEEARSNDAIRREATFAARDYMDFGQGGWASKAADNALPYLNASIQGTRGLFRALRDNKAASAWKLTQFAGAVTGLYIAMRKMHPKSTQALQGNIDMQNNLCVPLGDQFGFIDEKGQQRYIYFKVPLDPGQKFFKTFFEAAADKWLGNPVDVNTVVDSLKQLSPVGVSNLPPILSAILGYITNKDFWLNEDIWSKTDKPFDFPDSSQEYMPGRTPQAYVDLGKATGLSPERTRFAVEELTTSGTVWSYLLGKGYEEMFGDLPKSKKEQHLAMVLSKIPMVKRFIGVTNPYSQHAASIEKHESKDALAKWMQVRDLDSKVEGYLFQGNVSKKEIRDYIKSYKDVDVQERLLNRFVFQKAVKDLPNRSFWLRLEGLSPEPRAAAYYDRWKRTTPEDRVELRKEMAQISGAGNVITPEFWAEFGKLRRTAH